MAQRWMQSKLALARTHGLAISGAGRAMGGVLEDRNLGRVDLTVKGKPTKRRLLDMDDRIFDLEAGLTMIVRKGKADRDRYDATPPAWKRPRSVAR